MRKNSKHVPPALRHGIYSAIGLLPTEDPAEFEKFKLEIFDDYMPVGRSQKIIVEEIAGLQWRLQHLSTYGVAVRVRERHSAIHHGRFSRPQNSFDLHRKPRHSTSLRIGAALSLDLHPSNAALIFGYINTL